MCSGKLPPCHQQKPGLMQLVVGGQPPRLSRLRDVGGIRGAGRARSRTSRSPGVTFRSQATGARLRQVLWPLDDACPWPEWYRRDHSGMLQSLYAYVCARTAFDLQ